MEPVLADLMVKERQQTLLGVARKDARSTQPNWLKISHTPARNEQPKSAVPNLAQRLVARLAGSREAVGW